MCPARTLYISSEHEMSAFGAAISRALSPGTAVLLSGPIGAGKTHLARAIILAKLPEAEDVPSPTYTLVQTYLTGETEIWHADLYRLSDSSELVELGLDDAFETAIVLIEWPDRLPADLVPKSAVSIDLEPDGEGRHLTIAGPPKLLTDLLASHDQA